MITVADIAQWVGGELIGDGHAVVTGCSGIQDAKTGDVVFLADPKYLPQASATHASAILVGRQMSLNGKTIIRVDNPSFAFTQVLNRFLEAQPKRHPMSIHASAIIGAGAQIDPTASVGPYTVIEPEAVIGEGTVLYGHCTIGAGTKIGAGCLIYPGVGIRESVTIGNRVIIHNGAVIGCDGYGYVTVDGQHVKIPQIGTVVIEDDVEIGANVTIDRARLDKTVVGQGTKIDNLVHIAHNVVIGKHCLIVAQVGISGSARIGNYVILAGQVGVVGHLTIGDGAIVMAQSGISKSIKAGAQVFGTPAQPVKEAFRTNAHIKRLDLYVGTIKDLKQRIEELEQK